MKLNFVTNDKAKTIDLGSIPAKQVVFIANKYIFDINIYAYNRQKSNILTEIQRVGVSDYEIYDDHIKIFGVQEASLIQ